MKIKVSKEYEVPDGNYCNIGLNPMCQYLDGLLCPGGDYALS